MKSPNPKDAAAQSKVPLHVFPMTAVMGGSLALFDGLLKYGLANYRATEVNASVYHAAAMRHMFKWYAGEDIDVESGLPNTWHAIACIAILIDADAAGTLIDDREFPSGFLEMMRTKSSEVGRLRDMHASKNPKHYDRRDADKGTRMSDIRETARRYIIMRGGAYYKRILDRWQVPSFEELPPDAIDTLASEAQQESGPGAASDPAIRELVCQG